MVETKKTVRRFLPAYGQEVKVTFPGNDSWYAMGERCSKEEENKARWEQGWDETSVRLKFSGEGAGELDGVVAGFFGSEGWSDSLFFDRAPWSKTGWSLLLERSEYEVELSPVAGDEQIAMSGDGRNAERWERVKMLLAGIVDNWDEEEVEEYELNESFDEFVANLIGSVRFKNQKPTEPTDPKFMLLFNPLEPVSTVDSALRGLHGVSGGPFGDTENGVLAVYDVPAGQVTAFRSVAGTFESVLRVAEMPGKTGVRPP